MSTFEWLVGKAKVRLDDTFLMVLFRSVVATIVINVTAVLIWSVLAQVVEDVPKIALLGHLRFIVLFLFLSFIVSSYWVVYQRLKLVPKENITSRGFWYDDNGVLWNGNEQNIAFRIETFLGMLSGIRRNMEEDRLKDLLTEAGKKASKDFANRFVTSIYPIEIKPTYDNKYWKDLGVAERLTKWADYDSATGWGKISAVSAGGHIVISVSHQKLFTNDDEDGSVFQYFLAGYSETVLNRILAGKIGKVVLSRVFNENETAKIEFTTEE